MKWDYVSIEDLLDNGLYISDGNYSAKYPRADEFVSKGVPFIRANNLNNHIVVWDDMRFITPEKHALLKKGHVRINDVLITTRGNIGTAGIVPADFDDANINAQLVLLRCEEDKIAPDYLIWVFSLPEIHEQLNNLTTGTALQQLPVGNLLKLKIPLPPLSEQKRIAALLARADRLRQLRRAAHELGDSLLQSVFLEMFGDYFSKIECLFGDVLEIPLTNGFFETNDKYGEGNPIVWVDNLYHTNIIDTTYLRRVKVPEKDLNKYEVFEGDLLFTRSSLVADGVGQANIVPKLEERIMFESHVIRARVDKNKINPFFALGLFRSQFGKSEIMKRAKTSTMTTIGQDTLYEFPCPLPPLSEQAAFAGVVARVEALRGRMSEAGRQVEGLFESLLSEAFNG
jgi:type I restriction enzyme, S subunit